MTRPRSELALIDELGADFLIKIHELRSDLLQVVKLDGSTIEEVSLKSGVNIATIMEFIRGNKVYRTNMLSEAGPRTTKPPRDNISKKTYDLLRKYTDKRLRMLDLSE